MRKASWILLAFLGVVTLSFSILSANTAYRGDYRIGGTRLQEAAGGREEVVAALRGIRGTSAAYAAAYAVLFLGIVLGPYRRGDVGSWWTLLAGLLVLTAIVALRIPLLSQRLGVAAPLIQLGIGLVALLLDVGRLRSR